MSWDLFNHLPMNRGCKRWYRIYGPCRYCGSYSVFCTHSILGDMHFCSWKCEGAYWNIIIGASGYTPESHVHVESQSEGGQGERTQTLE